MSPTATSQDPSQRRLEQEIRGLISTLTHHLMSLGRSSDRQADEMPDNGSRIITLAGDNKGSTMRVAGWEEGFDAHGALHGGDEQLSALANSNYQAANNSILIGGGCTAENPGVHIVIADYVEDDTDGEEKHMKKKEKKEKKDKDKEEKKKKMKKKKEEEKGSSTEEEYEEEKKKKKEEEKGSSTEEEEKKKRMMKKEEEKGSSKEEEKRAIFRFRE